MLAVHPNYVKASNIMLLQLVIALLNYVLNYNDLHIRHKIFIPVGMIVVCGVVIYLLRTGTKWVKHYLLVSFAIANSKPANWSAMFGHGPLKIIWAITGICLGIWVLWLLFTVPNQEVSHKKGSDLPEPL